MAAVKLKSSHSPHFAMTKAIDFKYVEFDGKYGVQQDANKADQNYTVCSSGADGAVKTWNMSDQEHLSNFTIPKEKCTVITAHQIMPVLVSAFTDGFIRFFNLSNSQNLGRIKIENPEATNDFVISVKILPSGIHLIGVTKFGLVFLIFINSWDPL